MHQAQIENALATNHAFNKMFDRIEKVTARIGEKAMATEPSPSAKKKLEEIKDALKRGEPSALPRALAASIVSLDELVPDSVALGDLAKELVDTMPGAFLLNGKEAALDTVKAVLGRPALQSRLTQFGAEDPGESKSSLYKQILAADILKDTAELIAALVFDVYLDKFEAGTNRRIVFAMAFFEFFSWIMSIWSICSNYKINISG